MATMTTATPVTEAREWVLREYRIARSRGNTPLQGMFEVYQDAAGQVAYQSTAQSEWRKSYSRIYFNAIARRTKRLSLAGMYWQGGRRA